MTSSLSGSFLLSKNWKKRCRAPISMYPEYALNHVVNKLEKGRTFGGILDGAIANGRLFDSDAVPRINRVRHCHKPILGKDRKIAQRSKEACVIRVVLACVRGNPSNRRVREKSLTGRCEQWGLAGFYLRQGAQKGACAQGQFENRPHRYRCEEPRMMTCSFNNRWQLRNRFRVPCGRWL